MVQRLSAEGSGPAVTFSARMAIHVRSALAAGCLIALSVLTLSQVSAQDARDQAKQACMADYSRFCSGQMPGGGRIRKCLNDHYAELAPACRQALAANPPK